MAINYTSLLALIQPVDGTEVSVWGDDVNNGVSSILDVAVAGTQNLTTDANVTLTITQATSSGTNLTGTSAQYAIILLSGARTATRTVTLPASSKTYTVINSTTGGYAQTVGGLTIAVGEVAKIVYNIATTAWVKASTFSGAGVFSTVTATAATSGSSNLGAFNYGTLSFSDTGIVQSAQTSVNSYFQNVIQNTSAGTQAAAEFIAYNDQGTATTNYATIGINSSGYSGTGSINAAGYGYFLTGSTDLVLGTIGANGIHFTTNSSATDALAISSSGAVSLPGGTANGVAYLNGSQVLTTGSALTFNGTTFGVVGNGSVSGADGLFVSGAVSGGSPFISGGNLELGATATSAVVQAYNRPSFGAYNLDLKTTTAFTFSLAGSEQMRLTSTGLGIGTSSPSGKLSVAGSTGTVSIPTNGVQLAFSYGGANYISTTTAGGSLVFQTGASSTAATIDTSGNFGLGVTPSAWGGGLAKAFELSNGCYLTSYNSTTTTQSIYLGSNNYYNGSNYIYKYNGYAAQYQQVSGQHFWFNAASGTAGNAITFTQAMTLDANGNLLVGTTSAADSTVRTQSGSSSKDGRIQGWLSTSNGGGQGVLQLGAANTGTSTECTIKFVSGATALGSSPTSANGTQYSWGMGLGPYGVGGNVFAICNDSYTVNVKLNYNSSSWISVSDERIKNITANIENANQIIANWRTVYYTLKSDETNSVKIGLIAQDVQKTLPEVVDVPTKEYDDNNKLIPLGVHYSEVVPVLVKAIQELSTLITAQQSTIQSLTERLTALEGART